MQESQPLGHQLRDQIVDAGRVAARPGEAGDKTEFDRVFADAEHDRNRGCRSFSCARNRLMGAAITATRRRTRSAISAGSVLVIDPGWRVSTNSKKAERWQGSKSSSCGHTPASPRSRANSSRRRRRASGPASRRAASRTSCGRRAAAGAAGVAAKAECRPIGVPVKPPPADGRASTDGQRRPH
jgi:hypothetical protein